MSLPKTERPFKVTVYLKSGQTLNFVCSTLRLTQTGTGEIDSWQHTNSYPYTILDITQIAALSYRESP